MRNGVKLGLVAGAALGVLTGTAAPSLALEPGEAIALRQAIMKSNGAHFVAIKSAIAAGSGKAVALQANAIAAIAPNIHLAFPKGSGPGAGKTRAKANIWTEWDKFNADAKRLQTLALELAQVARTNDKRKMGAQFAKLARMGCGGCHDTFRAKKR
jgi:cytochrome c556